MFSKTLRTSLLALAASALSASAAPGLSLSVTGPGTVDTISDLKITTTLTNTGDTTLKVLNDPLSPINTLPANTFVLEGENGATPAFVGIKAKYVPSTAAKLGAYTELKPGEKVAMEHDLSQAYSFESSGEGVYAIKPNTLFHLVSDETTGETTTILADLANPHTAHVSGKLAVARPTSPSSAKFKRESYNGCSSSQQSSIVSAASAAQSYAASALSYANGHTASTTRYTTWFGTYTSARHSTITSHYSAISSGSYASDSYDCTCTDSGTYAYVYPDEFGQFFLCGAFWQAPTTGTDSKGGTLIHEASHFTANGGTDDYVYGQSAAKSLAISNPSEAVFNADNHEYFAENNPAQS